MQYLEHFYEISENKKKTMRSLILKLGNSKKNSLKHLIFQTMYINIFALKICVLFQCPFVKSINDNAFLLYVNLTTIYNNNKIIQIFSKSLQSLKGS